MAIDLPGAQSPENVEKREKLACLGVDLHENSSNQAFFHPEATACLRQTTNWPNRSVPMELKSTKQHPVNSSIVKGWSTGS